MGTNDGGQAWGRQEAGNWDVEMPVAAFGLVTGGKGRRVFTRGQDEYWELKRKSAHLRCVSIRARRYSDSMMTRFGSWHVRSGWIPPMCSEVLLKTIEITGSGPLTQSPPMLGAKWQTTVSVYYVSGGFPLWNDLHRWSGLSISQAVVFPHIGKTRSPPTSFFIQINIPDSLEEPGKENTAWMQNGSFLLQRTGVPETEVWEFTVHSSGGDQEIYTQILLYGRDLHLKSQCYSAPCLITSCINIPHRLSSPISNGFASLVSERGKKVQTGYFKGVLQGNTWREQ